MTRGQSFGSSSSTLLELCDHERGVVQGRCGSWIHRGQRQRSVFLYYIHATVQVFSEAIWTDTNMTVGSSV